MVFISLQANTSQLALRLPNSSRSTEVRPPYSFFCHTLNTLIFACVNLIFASPMHVQPMTTATAVHVVQHWSGIQCLLHSQPGFIHLRHTCAIVSAGMPLDSLAARATAVEPAGTIRPWLQLGSSSSSNPARGPAAGDDLTAVCVRFIVCCLRS